MPIFFCMSFEPISEIIFYQFHVLRIPKVFLETASFGNTEVWGADGAFTQKGFICVSCLQLTVQYI